VADGPPAAGPPADFDAIVLAGGRASRLGGADKPALLVGGRTLLASVVTAAISAGAQRIIVVGPARPELADRITFVREEPPGSGPVPALRCGLAQVSAASVLLLAADLPFLRARHIRVVLGRAAGVAGAIMIDDTGHPQWLAGCWQTAALMGALGGYAGSSLHGVLGPMKPLLLEPAVLGYDLASTEPPPWLDCDTADDLVRARALLAQAGAPETGRPNRAGHHQEREKRP
jgi:molybdopterin-guanine dinucleotide biosynthesis protein A